MTPQELIERLESLGLIDPKVLEKIRRQLKDPDKNVKPKAIVSYLVKKEHLTKAQAANLIKAIDAPKPVVHEEIEVSQPVENQYDTDDLTSTAQEVANVPAKIDPQMTMEAIAAEVGDESEAVEVVDVEPMIEAIPDDVHQMPAAVPAVAPMMDPLGGGYGADYDGGGAYGEEPEGEKGKASLGFQGKRLKKDQWATKWLYIGFGILGSLLIFGALLYYAVNRVSAEDQFKAAITSFENGAYTDAIEKLDKFIDDNPTHEKVNTARVRRVQALIAQTYESKNWDETIKRAKNQLPNLLENPDVKMDLIRDDLGVMLPNAALQISERAVKQTDLKGMEDQLVKAQDAKSVVDNPSYIPNSIRKRTSVANVLDKLDNNILSVQGLIRKENEYKDSLVVIEDLGKAGKTDSAFERYRELTRSYGDLATREQLQTIMKGVSAKERELVKAANVNLNISNSVRPSGVSKTIVLASKNGEKIDANRNLIVPVLASGALYGLDTSDGTVVWRHWLGYATEIQPDLFNPDVVMACDQTNNDLLFIKRLDGTILWRAEVGEPFLKPSFNEEMVVVTTKSGKIIKLDPNSGAVVASCQLPQAANVPSMIAERDPYIYQPGSYANLYVLSNEDLTCRDVYYLGHYKGSIEIAPQNWVGHILIAINSGKRCDLHVLKQADQGVGLELVQLYNRVTNGLVTSPMLRFGRWMLVTSDSGDMKILQLNPSEDETTPVTKFAEEKFEREAGQPAFMLSRGSQLWIAGKGIMKYKVQANMGKFERKMIQSHGDQFIAPLSMTEEALVHVRRREGSGMVSVSAVDPTTLKQIWRTDIGGPLAGAPSIVGGNLVAVSNQGDLFSLDSNAQTSGYSDDAVKSSNIVENLTFTDVVELGDNKFACVDQNRDDLLYVDGDKSRLVKLQAPANSIACRPLGIGDSLIVPSKKGVIVRVEARTGRMQGAPFQPPISPGVDVDWKEPVLMEGSIFAVAKGSADGSAGAVYLLDAGDGRSIKQIAAMESSSSIRSGLVTIDKVVYVVVTANQGDQLVSLNARKGLETIGSANLPANYVAGPWRAGNQILIRLDTDELACFDQQMQLKWKVKVPNEKMAGTPTMSNGNIAIALRSGKVVWFEPATGNAAKAVNLGQPVISLRNDGNRLLFGGMDGTIHISQAQ